MGLFFWIKKDANYAKVSGVIEPGIGFDHPEPVSVAADMTKHVEVPALASRRTEWSRLGEEINRMLPMEQPSKSKVLKRIFELEAAELDSKYQRIDMSFLRWRRKSDGWPVFAFFDADNPTCVIRCEDMRFSDRKQEILPAIPSLMGFYGDVFQKLHARALDSLAAGRADSALVHADFQGVIPEQMRRLIRDSQGLKEPHYDNFGKFDKVIVVAEASWEVKDYTAPKDPLIIGLKTNSVFHSVFDAWLIAKFDTTSVENIVASEFAGANNEPGGQAPHF